MTHFFETHIKFISKAFQRSIAYKLEYYTGLANAFLYIFIFTSVWRTVALESPGALGAWTGDALVNYAILSTLIKVSYGRNEYLLINKIKNGDIAYDIKSLEYFGEFAVLNIPDATTEEIKIVQL